MYVWILFGRFSLQRDFLQQFQSFKWFKKLTLLFYNQLGLILQADDGMRPVLGKILLRK